VSTPHERMDSEDLGTLGAMLQLGSEYIAEQDEPGDQKNIAPMEQALGIIAGLVPVEVAEGEPATEQDDE